MTSFRLTPGVQGPVQTGPTSCGPAALTVARMLVDPGVAGWIHRDVGDRDSSGAPPIYRNTNTFSGVCDPPDGYFIIALQDHVIAEYFRQPDIGARDSEEGYA